MCLKKPQKTNNCENVKRVSRTIRSYLVLERKATAVARPTVCKFDLVALEKKLQNANWIGIIGFDTVEKEPSNIWQRFGASRRISRRRCSPRPRALKVRLGSRRRKAVLDRVHPPPLPTVKTDGFFKQTTLFGLSVRLDLSFFLYRRYWRMLKKTTSTTDSITKCAKTILMTLLDQHFNACVRKCPTSRLTHQHFFFDSPLSRGCRRTRPAGARRTSAATG